MKSSEEEEEETKHGRASIEQGKGMSKTFGTAQTRKGTKREESRRIMNSYSTHNDVTALEICCCRRKNKKKRRKQMARL
jgi:hypothetical protein